MAGNVREWVDARMEPEVVTRLGWNPTIGKMVDNGIDRLTTRFHEIVPPSAGLGLLLGSDFSASATYQKQVDAETQYWDTITNSASTYGFRCVSLVKALMPTADKLSLPQPPVYQTGETIPEGRFVGDAQPEQVRVLVTDDTTPAGKIQIAWKAWSKTCSGSCSFTYDIWRIVEPTHQDYRGATAWALPAPAGGSSPYSAAKPLDPFAVLETTGASIWTDGEKVASGLAEGTNSCSLTSSVVYPPASNLAAPTQANCYEFSYTGTEAIRMYMYLVVAKDNQGNYMPPMIQRFRTPYLAGDFSTGAKATFRQEMRWRRASIGAVAETYQSGLTNPEVMVYVPLDQSGHDRDYYIQKYEAYLATGAIADQSEPNSNMPLVNTSGTWKSDLAACHEATDRDPATFPTVCGNLATTAKLASKVAVAPLGYSSSTSAGYATLWKGCRNSNLVVADGANTYSYNLHLATGPEFVKAADWGDLDLNGKVDSGLHPWLAGDTVVNTTEFTSTAGSENCHTETNYQFAGPDASRVQQAAVTGSRDNCISRYGAVDLVGNAYELTAERVTRSGSDGYYQDNGVDGLWLNQYEVPNREPQLNGLYIDLIRGFPYMATSPAASTSAGVLMTTIQGQWMSTDQGASTVGVGIGGGFDSTYSAGSQFNRGTHAPASRFNRGLDRTGQGGTGGSSGLVFFGGRCVR
jgi:hypothetical protein